MDGSGGREEGRKGRMYSRSVTGLGFLVFEDGVEVVWLGSTGFISVEEWCVWGSASSRSISALLSVSSCWVFMSWSWSAMLECEAASGGV